MTKNLFLANCAKVALALATTVMMSAAFTACSSSNNDDDGGGGTPEPEPKAQTVTLDGAEKPILKAEYEDKGNGNYRLYLYLSANHKEKVIMQLNKDLHITGNPIDLTKKEKTHDGKWYWSVEYYKSDGTKLIDTYGRSGYSIPVFTTGTLTISGSPDGTINIRLENGRVEGTDGKEYTLTVSYSGTMEKYGAPSPEPKAGTVTLDGEEKPILKAEYEDKGNGNYKLYLNLSADGKERVTIQLNKDLHITGNPIDLTKREEEHSGKWYWSVEYYKPDDTKLIDTYGKPGNSFPVFKTGTLTISGSPGGTINIKLENGRVEGLDGKEHTLVLSYSGTMTEKYVDLGLSVKWARCNLGASKPTDYGDYFAWGETEPKTNYTWATYKWMQAGKSDWQYITKYTAADRKTEGIWYDSDGNFIGDNKTTLDAADDAATANLGSPWRMPTGDEIQELIDNCTWTWTTQDGVKGYEVKSKKNGNSIFLPATGCRNGSEFINAGSWGLYWSSSLRSAYLSSAYARDLDFDSDGRDYTDPERYLGLSVRPVRP